MDYQQNQCQHIDLIPFNNKFFCRSCGIHMPEDGSIGIKAMNFCFPGYLNPIQNLKKQWNRAVPIGSLPNEYQKQRLSLIDYMIEWSEKLKLSMNSLFLAVQFLDYFVSQKKVDPVQYRLYGATCLMLAAKSIELDERIPFISKLRRYTYLPYATLDFRRCECQIIKQLNWNLQCTTLIDWAEAVISLGIVYQQDELAQSENILKEKSTNILQQQTNQQIKQDIFKEHLDTVFKQPITAHKQINEKVQEQLIRLCVSVLKDGSYLDKDPAELTVSVVGCARKASGLKTSIPKCLNELLENVEPKFQEGLTDHFIKQVKQPTSVLGRAFTTDLDFFSLQNYKHRIV
ncbi:unnamed protein product [Paramecium pentaurelia]|uniref:Cyclin-like domain-containing protein n=1 Tax=Paramecium pentaurelia TaxID=43138 RepID=A0A8S1SCU9_9CILI|nr:unnamed protein product [Paramecium pentaurelia]